VISLVENALQDNAREQLSNGLLNCYEQVCKDEKKFLVNDLIDAFPDLMAGLNRMVKASRPQMQHPLAGPVGCDLSEIIRLLNYLYTLLAQCCNGATISFNGTFTVFNDLQGTLTQCCANTTAEFDSTFTVINAIQNTLNTCCIDFTNALNGTFTVIANGINTLFPRLVTDLNAIEVLLDTDISLANTVVDQIVACCGNLESLLANCCNELISSSSAILNFSISMKEDTAYAQELSNVTYCTVCSAYILECVICGGTP
jgi:hypothetical protein